MHWHWLYWLAWLASMFIMYGAGIINERNAMEEENKKRFMEKEKEMVYCITCGLLKAKPQDVADLWSEDR